MRRIVIPEKYLWFDPMHPDRCQRPRRQDVGVQTDTSPNARYTQAFENEGARGLNQRIYDDVQQMDYNNIDNNCRENVQNLIRDAVDYHHTVADQTVARMLRHIHTNYSIRHEP